MGVALASNLPVLSPYVTGLALFSVPPGVFLELAPYDLGGRMLIDWKTTLMSEFGTLTKAVCQRCAILFLSGTYTSIFLSWLHLGVGPSSCTWPLPKSHRA